MSSYADLIVNDRRIFTYRNEVSPDALALFRLSELKSISSANPDAPIWSRSKYADDEFEDDEPVELCFYQVRAGVLKERLEVLGFGMALVRSEFTRELLEEIQRHKAYLADRNFARVQSELTSELTALESLTFESWLANVNSHVNEPSEDAVNPIGGYRKDGPLELLDDLDERLVMRAITEADPDALISLDVTDLVEGGWMDPHSSEGREEIESWLQRDSVPIIITEGKRDAEILEKSIALLKPHLSAYIKFLDYDFRNEGSAVSAVSTIKSFAAAGISNRILVLLDNDTAAYEAVRLLTRISLPSYYKVCHYPNLDLAKNYPTLGPQGNVTMDVNCLACSIEMYLGEDVLRMKSGELMPVQWKGFMSGVKAYQGEILDKTEVNKRFDAKLRLAEHDRSQIATQDWKGITAIIDNIIGILCDL